MQTRVKIIAGVSAAVLAAAGVTTGLTLSSGSGPDQPGPGSGSSPQLSPFTGEPVPGPRPVLAVKIDNLVDARPQTGVSHADIVYVLHVEGGLSRLMAVFSSRFPPVVGPVRSARLQDLELLRQFGRPAFAYSGAAPSALPAINRARIVNLRDGLAHGYFRDNRRVAPHNLYAHTSALRTQASGASDAHSIGFRFGPAPGGGRPVAAESVSYSAASLRFTWSAARARWLVWMDGSRAGSTEDGQLSAATVVIQYTQVKIPPATGPHAPTPFAKSVGSGRALVLRGGKVFQARWSRPAADDGTTFRTTSGQPMTFARGPVWIVLTAG
ncbi:MAG TPA: DUF3048 domain-containing protein [Streptosporangiaceae bacterium]|jgi:hypothetical protein|nr:DUF3048 domain-containing protein [Streptosporangiaceae bacterium]